MSKKAKKTKKVSKSKPPSKPSLFEQYQEVTAALKKSIERWEDPVMMSVLLPFYELTDFKNVGKLETSGQVIAGVLRMLNLISQRGDRRYVATTFGRLYVKHLQETKVLTPSHGADFIMRYGDRFGRRIQFDLVFIPEATR